MKKKCTILDDILKLANYLGLKLGTVYSRKEPGFPTITQEIKRWSTSPNKLSLSETEVYYLGPSCRLRTENYDFIPHDLAEEAFKSLSEQAVTKWNEEQKAKIIKKILRKK